MSIFHQQLPSAQLGSSVFSRSATEPRSLSPFLYTLLIRRVQQNKPSYVRFYRDYSIADLFFCASTLILITYAAFLGPVRAGVCEEFSHHPELMRDMGFNLEDCEPWLERAVFAVLAFLFVIMMIRVSHHPIIIQW